MKENLAAGFQSKLLSADGPRFQLAWVGLSPMHPARRARGQGGERRREGEQKQGSSVDLILPFPSFAPNTPGLSLPCCWPGRSVLQAANCAPSCPSPALLCSSVLVLLLSPRPLCGRWALPWHRPPGEAGLEAAEITQGSGARAEEGPPEGTGVAPKEETQHMLIDNNEVPG